MGKPVTAYDVQQLAGKALAIRREALKMIHRAGSGHPGGSLSAADLIAVLFFHEMRYNPADPRWPDRDRFILSKGHAVPALYAALAEAGFIPRELLATLRQIDSPLQGHPSVKDLPAVEASTGSLGQGLSIGVGMALAARLDRRTYRVYCLLGDGECQEGQVWEAAMSASHYRLDNLVAIIDFNKYQLDGAVNDILNLQPLAAKWEAFGWHVQEIDGHDLHQIVHALDVARETAGRPHAIIAHTVKGKGVSFMENDNEFHGRATTAEELERALRELAEPGLER